jgi:hypothetical protein
MMKKESDLLLSWDSFTDQSNDKIYDYQEKAFCVIGTVSVV